MTIWTELPGAYLDNVETSGFTGVLVANTIPEEDSVGAADTNIVLEILATTNDGVDQTATEVYVEGTLAYDGGGSGFQSGFDGAGSAVASIGIGDLRITIDPTTDFFSEQVVDVRVVSANLSATHSVDYTYSFTIADIVQPTLISARARGPMLIRVVFSEDMEAASATGENDALNPDNYEFDFQPETDRQAGVAVYPVSVEAISGTTYDVTVDMELSFWRTYLLTCGDIADDAGNLLATGSRSATFASWYPPFWPSRRQFDLWSMFSDDDHDADDLVGDHERLMSALQDVVDIMLWDIDAMQFIWDVDYCPEKYLPAMLADLGNPFNFDLSENRQRKLISILTQIYKRKGSASGIIDVIRFFLGLEVTDIDSYNLDSWLLGEGILGIDTYLGPSNQAALYTFLVNVDETLSDDDRSIMERVIRFMKTAHTHFQIIEPSSPLFVDHWSLGESYLGEETYVHE